MKAQVKNVPLKRNKIVSAVLLGFVLAGLVFAAGCISDRDAGQVSVEGQGSAGLNNEYVFLEHHVNEYGELVEGNDYPYMCVDFPTYWFDEENRVLGIYAGMPVPFEINESLIMIVGDGSSISGAIGSGAGTGTDGVYSLPYKGYDFEILSVSEEGTVEISYRNETIVLEAGEKWENIEFSTDQNDEPYAVVNITTTDTFTNYGFVKADNIEIDLS